MKPPPTPKGNRLHIGIYGRRNVGKSSLLNALTRQQVAIVSEFAGTTTDPVEKPMELLPLGPVLFIDTAGMDDVGSLGSLRIQKTRQAFERTEIALIVADGSGWGAYEEELVEQFRRRQVPIIAIFNKSDLSRPAEPELKRLRDRGLPVVCLSADTGEGLTELRSTLLQSAPKDFIEAPSILGDLVGPGELAVLVVPIDKEAPKGRLILPQVQTIRDLLDHDAMSLVVKERELSHALSQLQAPPRLVVTDSQAFLKVAADVPVDVWMTSFSILFARLKGDLVSLTAGALSIDQLRSGDQVLVSESCSHHPIGEDIGRVKIPRWLTQYVGGKLNFHHVQGHDFPEDLTGYKLVIHCGSCMLNRREMMNRIWRCQEQHVAITNYGLTIALSLGILERALAPFPAALDLYRRVQERAVPS